jgi:hypothetical protein
MTDGGLCEALYLYWNKQLIRNFMCGLDLILPLNHRERIAQGVQKVRPDV